MDWQDGSKRLTEVLELEKAPVAVTYTDKLPEGLTPHKSRVCSALRLAAGGKTVALCRETSTCGGGTLYLGFARQAPEQARTLREFLIEGEKLFSCAAALLRMQVLSEAQPPLGAADYVVFAPLEEAALAPDVAVITCNAGQAARLVNLATWETGEPLHCDPSGALCRAAITYALVTGRVNVSFGDVTARRSERMPAGDLYVSLPLTHLRSVVGALERCSAGTATIEIPPAMRRQMAQGGGEVMEV